MAPMWNMRLFRQWIGNGREHRVETHQVSFFGSIVTTLLPSIPQTERYQILPDEHDERNDLANLLEAGGRKTHGHSDIELVKAGHSPSVPSSLPESTSRVHRSLSQHRIVLDPDKAPFTSLQIVKDLKPVHPVTLIHPHETARAARSFVTEFQGHPMYAIKANDSLDLLSILWNNGVTWFDVASINEVRLVSRHLPEATLCFMNPVKSAEAIQEAYFVHGVRSFSLDSDDELDKILRSTATDLGPATDLNLFVRLQVTSRHARLSLESKFGISGQEAKLLLQAVRKSKNKTGICFHVGSQVMGRGDFAGGLQQAHAMALEAGFQVDFVSVGGGFAVKYPDMEPPSPLEHLEEIHRAFHSLQFPPTTVLLAEPGRCLSAWHHSMLLRIEKRRGSALYLNDGVYGTLSDAGRLNWPYFTRLLRDPPSKERSMPFRLYGPTCDTLDSFGPWDIPSDAKQGDYLEIFGLGAYGGVMRTRFNGYDTFESIVVQDEPTDLVIERYYQSR
jgi:ornithine decarboxylase